MKRIGRLIVYRDSKKEWRWRLKLPNGRVIADSGEGYKRRSTAIKMASILVIWAANSRLVILDETKQKKKGETQ